MASSQLEAYAENSVQTLKARALCFSTWQDKMEDEMHKVKPSAERRLATLEQKHQDELVHDHSLLLKMKQDHLKVDSALDTKAKSDLYKCHREHTKAEVALHNEVHVSCRLGWH